VNNVEIKLASIQTIEQPEVRHEDGLPVTDIYEELDEDGNIICGCSSSQTVVRR